MSLASLYFTLKFKLIVVFLIARQVLTWNLRLMCFGLLEQYIMMPSGRSAQGLWQVQRWQGWPRGNIA